VRNVILMTLVMVLLLMGRGAVGPLTSIYSRELGASYSMIALLGTVASVFSLASSYFWGHISDRTFRRKRYMVLGLVVILVTRLITATVPSYVYLFPLRAIEAIALAAYSVTSLALMGDILETSGGRGARMGLYRGLASGGFGLMAFFAGSIADRFGLSVNYVVSAAFIAVAIVLALAVTESEPAADSGESASLVQSDSVDETTKLSAVAETVSERRLPILPLLVAALVWFAMFGAVYSVWANYMVEELGYSSTVMTRLWAIASSSELVFMVLAGLISDRIGRLPMMAVGFLMWALVFGGYLVVPILPWIILVQLVRGFAYSAYTATAMTYATEVSSRKERGRASGLYSSASGLGSILGAMAGGLLVQWVGFGSMLAICAAIALLTALYMGIVAIQWRRGAVAIT